MGLSAVGGALYALEQDVHPDPVPQYPYLGLATGLLFLIGAVPAGKETRQNVLVTMGGLCLIPQSVAALVALMGLGLALLGSLLLSPFSVLTDSPFALIQEALVFLLEVWALLFIILLHLTLNWVFFLFALWFPIRMSASQSAEREIVLKKVLICCGGLWGAHHWAEKRFRAALLYLFTFGGATILVIRDLRSLPQLHPPPLPHTSSSPPPPPVNPTNRPPPKESHWLLQFIIPAGFIGFLTWGFHDLVPGPAGIGLVVSAGVGILAYLGLISVKTLFLHRNLS